MSNDESVAATLMDLKRVAEVADAVGLADTRADALKALLAFRSEVRQQCEAECARDARMWRHVRPLFQWNEIGRGGRPVAREPLPVGAPHDRGRNREIATVVKQGSRLSQLGISSIPCNHLIAPTGEQDDCLRIHRCRHRSGGAVMNAVKAKPRYLSGPSPVHVTKAVEATVVLMENLVMQLYFRWLDEREYEDFADYEKRMKDVLAEKTVGLTFVKGTKQPFGFHFSVDGFHAIYSIVCTTRSYGWKRVS